MKDGYVEYLKSDKKSQNTIDNYVRYVDEFMRFVNKDEANVEFNDMVDYKTMLAMKNLVPASINLRIGAVKSYFDWLRRAHIIDVNLIADVKVVKNNHPKEKEYVSPEDVKAIIDAMRTFKGKAIVALLANTGMRFSEMNSITVEQYNEMKALNRHYITIIGKGNKARKVFFNADAEKYIDMYLREAEAKGFKPKQWIFETTGGKQMVLTNVDKQLKEAANRAGLHYGDNFSAHWLRACFATNKLMNGTPITVVRDLMGHGDIAVTNRYLKTNDDMLEEYGLKGL